VAGLVCGDVMVDQSGLVEGVPCLGLKMDLASNSRRPFFGSVAGVVCHSAESVYGMFVWGTVKFKFQGPSMVS